MQAKPFLKWAGGKRRLAEQIIAHFPERFGTYYEPFLGGGAVFFALSARCPLKAVLSDSNAELINAYRCVRDSLPELVVELFKLEHMNTAEDYYRMRACDAILRGPVARAARMIYLNHTCFNGLYRVNSHGEFNVPFGRQKNPLICNQENLRLVNEALQDTTLYYQDVFDDRDGVGEQAEAGDLVYFDPPYHSVSAKSSFTRYTIRDFGPEHQERLAELFARLVARGVHCVLSNSDTPFVRNLYRGFRIERVLARRSIGASAASKTTVGELIITS